MQAFDSTDSDLQFRGCLFTRYKPDRTSLSIEINNIWLTMASLLAVGAIPLHGDALQLSSRPFASSHSENTSLNSTSQLGCSGRDVVVDNGPDGGTDGCPDTYPSNGG